MTDTMIIDGHSIYNYFMCGAQKIIYNERDLNKINVFPVADGDTGTNLALTMKMVLTNATKNKDVSKTLASISEVATENAYGNSGMIFAQYLNGFAQETKEKQHISIDEFIHIADKASQYAYSAVASPKEGTILSVMRGWAHEMKNMIDMPSFEHLLDMSIKKARELVEKTKTQLKVLSDNNVEDAGAKAFLFFIEGIFEFIKKGKAVNNYTAANTTLDGHKDFIPLDAEIKHRYCTQFYIETQNSTEELKKTLNGLGDSLVLTGNGNRIKIHIHTNSPDKVLDALSEDNKILSQKIEDMKLENSILRHKLAKTAIVTDSIADIPREMLDKHQITVIPINLICDSLVYLDKLTITPETFYSKIDAYKMNPTSAQPTQSVIEKAFSSLLEHYESVIGIFVSKKMSGTFGSAQKAAQKLKDKGQITVIDSGVNSAAQGLVVLEAAKMAEENLSHEEIVERLEELKKRVRIFVSVDDLTHMIRGGRIPKTLGAVLSFIKLKPVISIDKNGNGTVYKKTLTKKSALESIMLTAKEDMKKDGIEKYCLVYSDDKADLSELESKFSALTDKKPQYITPISPVVGLNAGKGSFAVAYIKGGG